MENLSLDRGEDDNTMPCSLNNSEESERKLETGFQKISSKPPLVLDLKQQNDARIRPSKLCKCGEKLHVPNYISFVTPDNKFPKHCISCGNKSSDSLSIIYGMASLLNVPMSLKSSGFSFETRKKQTRSRSLDNVDDFIFESSLLFQFGVLDVKRSQPKFASANTSLIKSSELFASPSILRKSIARQSSELNASERKFASGSVTYSKCSNSSSQGMLSCVWKNGVPYFVFSLEKNHGGNLYVAYPHKVKSSIDMSMDYLYLFRSRNASSGIVGKMKVSTSLVLKSNMSKLMETEFVLFGSREDYLKEMESSPATLTASKKLSRKVTEIFRSSSTSKHKAVHNFGESSFQFDNAQDFSPNLELAAIVVKDNKWKCNREVSIGGWGLRFLENARVNDYENTEEPSFSCKHFEENFKRNCEEFMRKINVIVPSGFHGGPVNKFSGASSLIERWNSGGYCDCGGWDLGCPLRVLSNDSTCPINLAEEELEEDRQPVCLYLEGSEHGEPTLSMVNKSKGLYLVNFNSSLSALQAFSIAVAAIHSRTPSLYPKI